MDETFTLAKEILDFLNTIKDEGTEIDSGGGFGGSDLWVTIGGEEFIIQVKKS